MTTSLKGKKGTLISKKADGFIKSLAAILSVGAVFALSLLYPDRIAHSVKSGLSLCANVIIPTVFPFTVLSEFIYCFCDFSSIKCIGSLFERVFKINKCGIYPFLLGLTCGFPLGVKVAGQMYRDGSLTKDEAERIISFCNNTGPAFVICGIGAGLRGNVAEGIILYLSMVISALAVGAVLAFGKQQGRSHTSIRHQRPFSLTEAIKSAGAGTLTVCSYITFFACAVGMLRAFLSESLPYLLLISFVEVGSATSILSKTALLSDLPSLTLTAFAISFSGFSVHLQAWSMISDLDLSFSKYLGAKLLQGLLSALLVIPMHEIIL